MCANRHSKEVEINYSSVKNSSNGTPETEAPNSIVALLPSPESKALVEHHVIKLAATTAEPGECEVFTASCSLKLSYVSYV